MLNPAHILETAFLLLAAFLIGASVGSLAKVVFLRLRPAKAAAVVQPRAVVAEKSDAPAALVAAPVIEPVSKPAQPVAPAEVPVPDFSEVAKSIEAPMAPLAEVRVPKVAPLPPIEAGKRPVMTPAREAGKTTSGKIVPSPRVTDGLDAERAKGTGTIADVIPFPDRGAPPAEAPTVEDTAQSPVENAPAVEESAVEAGRPTAALEVSTTAAEGSDTSGSELDQGARAEPAIIVAATPEGQPNDTRVAEEPATLEAAAEADVPGTAALAVNTTAEPDQIELPEADPAKAAEPAVAETVAQAATDEAIATEDETAAMRAIEGTWTPRRAAVRRVGKAPMPEGIADEDADSGERPGVVEPGKPVGIEAPRGGVKDNLTNVIGILPVIETSLNSMGVYHFDQISALNDDNVAWIESHLGIAGRIDREHWREQARELAVISDRARKVAGKH